MSDSETKQVALAARNIHKEFVLPQHKNNSVKQAFVNIVRRNGKTIQKVLDGVDFEVNKGDFFGIVGRNGSGKSTLLKILAGVYTPTSGEVIVNGSLTPFIELGVGFNPELSGRDNVYLNGALLGFSHKEMEAMYDEIVEFAEIEPFMDQKLKNYSSGMQVRLAFSIAIKAHGDILIFDEVLAVGDEAFQRKCLDVFERYKAEGQTVILVTHEMETVRKFCNRAVLISDGKLLASSSPQRVADQYSKLNQEVIDQEVEQKNLQVKAQNLKAHIFNNAGHPAQSFKISEAVKLRLSWHGCNGVKIIMVDLFRQAGEHVSGFKSLSDGVVLSQGNKADVTITLDLAPGKYYLKIAVRDKDDNNIETLYHACEFMVTAEWPKGRPTWAGIVPINHVWH